MTERRETTMGRRPRLDRRRVLDAAVAMADEGGIDSLSMRRLGQRLGVEAMSLYNHVADKDDLLAGMLEIVVSEFELAVEPDAWKSAVRESALAARGALARHAWAGTLLLSTLRPGPARLRHMDRMLGRFRRAGFSVEMAHHALHAVDGHVLGYAIQQASFPIPAEEADAVARAFLRQLDTEAYPHLAEHIVYHVEVSGLSDEADFEFGLDLILDGLERLQAGIGSGRDRHPGRDTRKRPRRGGAARGG